MWDLAGGAGGSRGKGCEGRGELVGGTAQGTSDSQTVRPREGADILEKHRGMGLQVTCRLHHHLSPVHTSAHCQLHEGRAQPVLLSAPGRPSTPARCGQPSDCTALFTF